VLPELEAGGGLYEESVGYSQQITMLDCKNSLNATPLVGIPSNTASLPTTLSPTWHPAGRRTCFATIEEIHAENDAQFCTWHSSRT